MYTKVTISLENDISLLPFSILFEGHVPRKSVKQKLKEGSSVHFSI